jgi:hypothetical protein
MITYDKLTIKWKYNILNNFGNELKNIKATNNFKNMQLYKLTSPTFDYIIEELCNFFLSKEYTSFFLYDNIYKLEDLIYNYNIVYNKCIILSFGFNNLLYNSNNKILLENNDLYIFDKVENFTLILRTNNIIILFFI